MHFPLLDTREKQEIYNQLIELMKSYVPEWTHSEDPSDYGHLLTLLFSEMFAETIDRYNEIPYKNLIYFLNLLGASPLPCVSSKGFVTAKVNEGTQRGVYVKKNTCVYGQDVDGERVVFELKDDLLLVDNEVVAVYEKSFLKNKIIRCMTIDEYIETPFSVFDFQRGENLQKHTIYFGNLPVLFNNGEIKIILKIVNTVEPHLEEMTANQLTDPEVVQWECNTLFGFFPIDMVEAVGNEIHITLEDGLSPSFLFDEISHWISCTVIDNKKYDSITFSHMQLSSKAENIEPDRLYLNDIALEKVGACLPFGATFSLYNDFYIKSDATFTKAGAMVYLSFDLDIAITEQEDVAKEYPTKWKHLLHKKDVFAPEPLDVYVEKVLWEYWNGQGWIRLFVDKEYEDFFKNTEKCTKEIRFICPSDMEEVFVGADQGFFLRARIVLTNQAFQLGGRYIAPVLNRLSMAYQYNEVTMYPEHFYIEKDMEILPYSPKNAEVIRFFQKEEEEPCVYFALKNPLPKGIIKMQIVMENDFLDTDLPTLKWEYFGKMYENSTSATWKEMTVSDGTNHFRKTGIITFVCQGDFVEKAMFLEEAYWIRVVNMDKRYETDAVPVPKIKEILFNTVPIEQKEQLSHEYFFIDQGEVDKRCFVQGKNVVELTVWVNEWTGYFQNQATYEAIEAEFEVRKEVDESGNMTAYWVRWESVSSLKGCDKNDRAYVFLQEDSCICFGDGVQGKIPNSLLQESIAVEYSISVGENGNFSPDQISGFTTAVPFVEKVTNHHSILGGCNAETMREAIERSMQTIRHQNKIVSKEDFYEIAKHANRNIAQVKVRTVSNQGSVEIAVLPKEIASNETRNDEYFLEIQKNLMKEFQKKAPAVLTSGNHISVLEATYIEYRVHLRIVIEEYNDYHEVYQEVERNLEKFLHPITGNFQGNGFTMGELPNKIQIYHYIKNVKKIIEIEDIYITCYLKEKHHITELDYSDIFDLLYAVPISGKHKIQAVPRTTE
ncbi:MAG: baseplate J/gp47 family protein [Bacillota bacterium]